ncbi:TRAP transporter small permease [Octadecabacter sp. CECT 8868]|uniref:TRAP transporter small permease subunit n=1 Tax=Octadecabacter algicola TaxID=2909342 RepID=UPI001F3B638D|nr:TRAP transporter small permease [Octadecabacter algicola]MCF2903914.1 TRAP transporter small permease [Octadecabacter algicola]
MLKAIDRLSFVMALASGVALLVIAVLIAAEIILRKFFGISMHFLWEIASFIQLTAVFLGAGWTLRTGGHIRVTIISSKAPRLFEWLATLFGLAISAYLTKALVLMAWGYFETGRTTGTVTDTPLVYPAVLVAFGAAMLTLQLALRALRLATGEETETDQTGASTDVLTME